MHMIRYISIGVHCTSSYTLRNDIATSYDFQAGQRMGWTGFTWDKHLFPNPTMFLDWYVSDTQKVSPGDTFPPALIGENFVHFFV